MSRLAQASCQLTRVHDANSKAANSWPGNRTKYTYDALGELTSWKDAKCGTSCFSMTYDPLSRPLTRTEPDYFTQWTWGSSASSDNIGKLASVCTGVPAANGDHPNSCTANDTSASGYSESETYDRLSRLSQRSIVIPSSGTYTYKLGYSSTTGLLQNLTYPVSTSSYAFELQYGYTNNILTSLTDVSDTPNVTLWTAKATNGAEQITEETLGNGIVTTRTYDAVTNWLSSVQSGVSGGSGVQNQSFV
jgi:YD repeat-containing protein